MADISTNVSKAFDFAQDATKQVITLATAIVTFTVTFLKDLAASAPQDARNWLTYAWIAYFASICFGLLALLKMTGDLERSASPSIYGWFTRGLSFIQIVLFAVGLGLTLLFGANAQPKP